MSALLNILHDRLVVGDGAMGTEIYRRGVPLGVSYDDLNRSRPELIAEIHRSYVEAGAEVIETNTFGANRLRLAQFGLEDWVEEINEAGVVVAREAAPGAFLLGSVGALETGPESEYSADAVASALAEQIAALAEAGVDAIVLETFLDLGSLEAALATHQATTSLPALCQLSVDESATTRDGVALGEAFRRLLAAGAAAVGVNCRSGPAAIIRALEASALPADAILSAFPNAGYPDYIDGRYIYRASPEYFADSADRLRQLGVRLVGGCCGTTPDHIGAIAARLRGRQPVAVAVREAPAAPVAPVPPPAVEAPSLAVLPSQRRTVIVELDPPKDLDITPIIEGAHALKAAGADAITMADNSLGVTRMSNIALAHIAHRESGLEPVVHIACRDRNLIGLQSVLMGLHAFGIRHLLAVTGDPAKFGDQPGATSVYDVSSTNLVRLITQLNEGVSFSGRPMKGRTDFCIGVALNPNSRNLDGQVRRLERKLANGAHFVMTQPIFRPEQVEELYTATRHLEAPIYVGIWPLVSARNAEFLHNEVPGFSIPDEVRARMARYERERAREEGVTIAKEMLDIVLERFNSIDLYTPFARWEMTVELTRYVAERRVAPAPPPAGVAEP